MKTIFISLIVSLIITSLGFCIFLNLPINLVRILEEGMLGATVTEITGDTQVSDFPDIHNTNINNLNNDKLETSDWIATTSAPQLITLTGVTTLGTIVTGIWNSNVITVAYGGIGSSSLTNKALLFGNGTGAIQSTIFGTSGQFLTSQGSSTLPIWTTAAVNQATDYVWTGIHTFATTTIATTTIQGAYIASSTLASTTIRQLNLNGQNANNLVAGATTDASALHYHPGMCAVGIGLQAKNTTGSQVVTHNLGSTPSYIQIDAAGITDGTLDGVSTSFGLATSTASQYVLGKVPFWTGTDDNASANAVFIGDVGNIIMLRDDAAATEASAALSALSAVTFTLNWTTNGNDTYSTARFFTWTVCK